MSTRKYIMQINDIKTNQPIIYIDSDKSPFQIKTSFSYVDVSFSAALIYLEIFNFMDNLDPRSLINNKITLIAGTNYGSMLKLNNVDKGVISPKLILSGYIYDASYDYSQMPRQKLNIKIRNFVTQINEKPATTVEGTLNTRNIDDLTSKNYIQSQISVGPVYGKGDSPSKPFKSNLILSKGADVINFCKRVFKQYTGEELYNMTGEQKIINNFDTISYYFDPRRNDIVNTLNNFLDIFSRQGYAFPLSITSNLTGFCIGINYATCSNEVIEKLIKKYKDLKKFKSVEQAKNQTERSYFEQYNRNLLQEIRSEFYPTSYNLSNNLLISPPVRTAFNRVTIQTMLIPSIKKGDLITIGNLLKETNPDGSSKKVTPAASVASGVQNSTAATFNGLSGTFLVDSVTHNLNFAESSPVSWSTVIELIQNPQSINVPIERMYFEIK